MATKGERERIEKREPKRTEWYDSVLMESETECEMHIREMAEQSKELTQSMVARKTTVPEQNDTMPFQTRRVRTRVPVSNQETKDDPNITILSSTTNYAPHNDAHI